MTHKQRLAVIGHALASLREKTPAQLRKMERWMTPEHIEEILGPGGFRLADPEDDQERMMSLIEETHRLMREREKPSKRPDNA